MSNGTVKFFSKKSVAGLADMLDRSRLFMRKFLITITLTTLACATFCPHHASALVFSAPKPTFAYTDASGKKQSVEVVDKYYPKKIVEPFAKVDGNIDPKLRRAAPISPGGGGPHSPSKCLRFFKEGPFGAGVVECRARTTP